MTELLLKFHKIKERRGNQKFEESKKLPGNIIVEEIPKDLELILKHSAKKSAKNFFISSKFDFVVKKNEEELSSLHTGKDFQILMIFVCQKLGRINVSLRYK